MKKLVWSGTKTGNRSKKNSEDLFGKGFKLSAKANFFLSRHPPRMGDEYFEKCPVTGQIPK